MAMKRPVRLALIILVVLLLVLPAVMAAAWIGTETMVERTSGAEFCSRCHTMTPFAKSHSEDVHGGDNRGGVVAQCTDCHLPHDSPVSHLIAKAQTGLRDAWAQAIYWIHKPDWLEGLEERAEYVYDSGCLSCHAALERVTTGDQSAIMAHRAYFGGQMKGGCVTCHKHVGHENLREALAAHFDEVVFVAAEGEAVGAEAAGAEDQDEGASTEGSGPAESSSQGS